jgi:hypothetical protein
MQKGCSTCMCTYARPGPLHKPTASAQQPPTGRLLVPKLAERRSTKAWQLHRQWKAREDWGTRDKVGDGLVLYWTHMCSP